MHQTLLQVKHRSGCRQLQLGRLPPLPTLHTTIVTADATATSAAGAATTATATTASGSTIPMRQHVQQCKQRSRS